MRSIQIKLQRLDKDIDKSCCYPVQAPHELIRTIPLFGSSLFGKLNKSQIEKVAEAIRLFFYIKECDPAGFTYLAQCLLDVGQQDEWRSATAAHREVQGIIGTYQQMQAVLYDANSSKEERLALLGEAAQIEEKTQALTEALLTYEDDIARKLQSKG